MSKVFFNFFSLHHYRILCFSTISLSPSVSAKVLSAMCNFMLWELDGHVKIDNGKRVIYSLEKSFFFFALSNSEQMKQVSLFRLFKLLSFPVDDLLSLIVKRKIYSHAWDVLDSFAKNSPFLVNHGSFHKSIDR